MCLNFSDIFSIFLIYLSSNKVFTESVIVRGGREVSSVPRILLRNWIKCLGDVQEGRLWSAEREAGAQCDKMEE